MIWCLQREKNHVIARARIQYHIRGTRQFFFSSSIPVACDSLYPVLPSSVLLRLVSGIPLEEAAFHGYMMNRGPGRPVPPVLKKGGNRQIRETGKMPIGKSE